jgi:hypothetical protein
VSTSLSEALNAPPVSTSAPILANPSSNELPTETAIEHWTADTEPSLRIDIEQHQSPLMRPEAKSTLFVQVLNAPLGFSFEQFNDQAQSFEVATEEAAATEEENACELRVGIEIRAGLSMASHDHNHDDDDDNDIDIDIDIDTNDCYDKKTVATLINPEPELDTVPGSGERPVTLNLAVQVTEEDSNSSLNDDEVENAEDK